MTSAEDHPRPAELEDKLDEITSTPADPPPNSGTEVHLNPNETPAEHEPMAIADADHKQEPSEQFAGGQQGG